jgi:phospholipid/cholesterol/gamma-HCH transport system substrate-binding protein
VKRNQIIAYGALALAVIVTVIVATSSGGGGYIVKAEFKDAGGLRKDSSVKIAGVTGGAVTSVVATPRDTAIATIELDSNAAPIGEGASVEVRPTDLLGERYAQLNVGDLNKPLPSGSLIPINRTSAPVELDDILNTFNADTRTRLRILINEAGVALAGRGADFNTLLRTLPPNIGQARALLGQVASQNVALSNLIAEGDRITASVNGKRDDLGTLIIQADRSLGAVADSHAQLGATITNAPGALTQLRAALDQVGSAADQIVPAASSLQRAAAPLTATLGTLPSFADSAHAALQTARQVAPDLVRLGRDAQSPIKALRPTARELESVTRQAQPILAEEDTRAMRDQLWFIENWALGMKGRDSLGHFVGANLTFDSSIFQSALDGLVNNSNPPAANGDVKRRAAPKLSVANIVAAAPKAVTPAGLVNSLQKAINPLLGKVVGGTTSTVNNTVSKAKQGLSAITGGSQGGTSTTSSAQSSNDMQHLLNYLLGK